MQQACVLALSASLHNGWVCCGSLDQIFLMDVYRKLFRSMWSSPTEGAQSYLMDLVSSNGIHLDAFNSILPNGVTAIVLCDQSETNY